MSTRSAHEDMSNLYGGGIEELLSQHMREENALPADLEESDYPMMAIKRKKQSAILKAILKEGGYGDLAKQVSIRRGG